MSRAIDYGNLMHRALRGLIREVLTDVAENGLPGQHHFFITFDTMHPDVEIADWLSDRYPGEMTVVMQHWFDKLTVEEEGFAVTLNFGDAPESLYIPYDAILTFVDPSVEFGLRFENNDGKAEGLHSVRDDEDLAEPAQIGNGKLPPADVDADDEDDAGEQGKDAEIVSLDSFRK